MWDECDKAAFIIKTAQSIGQIKSDSIIAKSIRKLCLDTNNKTFLEIGTWNGYGSTRIFVESLKDRHDTRFYSLECNQEKSEFARHLYRNVSNVFILNEVIPVLNIVEFENLKKCKLFLERDENFDVVFLDGGEFTTYYEFQILKNKCTYLLLNDTNTNKCAKIIEEIYRDTDTWNVLQHERNGMLLCLRR